MTPCSYKCAIHRDRQEQNAPCPRKLHVETGTIDGKEAESGSRDEILNAAEEVLGSAGFEDASIWEIPCRAPVTRKAAYNQFSPNEDVADQTLARMEASVEPLYRGRIPPGEDADFLSTALLGNYAQGMIAVISGFPYDPEQIRRIDRVLIECIGRIHSNSSPSRSETARGMTPSAIALD